MKRSGNGNLKQMSNPLDGLPHLSHAVKALLEGGILVQDREDFRLYVSADDGGRPVTRFTQIKQGLEEALIPGADPDLIRVGEKTVSPCYDTESEAMYHGMALDRVTGEALKRLHEHHKLNRMGFVDLADFANMPDPLQAAIGACKRHVARDLN